MWERGFTGSGVVVTIVDDGMEHDHPDLVDNYDPLASIDLNGNDADPFPNEADPINKCVRAAIRRCDARQTRHAVLRRGCGRQKLVLRRGRRVRLQDWRFALRAPMRRC